MNKLLKTACLAIYVLAAAGSMGLLPEAWARVTQGLAALFLAVHLLELVFVFKYVRLYKGALITSVMFTLLFGLLHWVPLVKQGKGV